MTELKRKRGRPPGTGKNQLIRRGLKKLPIYNSTGKMFLVGLGIRGNDRALKYMRSGDVRFLSLVGSRLYLVFEDGSRVAV